MDIISIQPGQPGEGMEYNVMKSLPYPYHVDTDTLQIRVGPQTRNELWTLVGFQTGSTQRMTLSAAQFLDSPEDAIGLVPVMSAKGSGFFNMTVPITSVKDHR